MAEPKTEAMRLSDRLRHIAPAAAGLLATSAYLLTLTEFYRWWVVLLVAPLALFGGMIVTGVIAIACDTWISRLLCLLLGAGWIYLGITEPDRIGSLLTGTALVILGCFPWKSEGGPRSADTDDSRRDGGESKASWPGNTTADDADGRG